MKICTSEQEYINAIAPAVQKVCKRYGYLPSVLIGQSCLENGYGIPDYWDNLQIQALLKYNNMVGIKSQLLNKSWDDKTVWTGQSLTKKTPEVYGGKPVTITDNFRKYDTIERSFADFLLFITYASNDGKGGAPKYGQKVLSIKDPKTLITKVGSLGYATGPTYPTSVMKIVNKHNLTKYDDLSNVEPTIYTPGHKGGDTPTPAPKSNVIKLKDRKINDITARNKSQVPASRGSVSPSFIVCHYLGVPNADNPDLYGGGYGGHYNIERNGSIYKAANAKTAVVWHCGGGLQGDGGHTFYKICTNYNSIGIQCGVCADTTKKDLNGDSNLWYFTEETQESLVWLVSKLMDEFGISFDHVIRHYDVTGKICPNPYVKNNNRKTSWTWTQFKNNLKQYRKDGTITIPNGNTPAPQPEDEHWYRIRKTWKDEKSQKGAYKDLDNAKRDCPAGYTVFDWNGKAVYTAPENPTVEKWYRIRKTWKNEKSQKGAYKDLEKAKADCPVGYTVFDWNGNAVYKKEVAAAPKVQKAPSQSAREAASARIITVTFTRNKFVDAVENVYLLANQGHWKYGDSHSTIPCADKIISCDRLEARALYDLGFTDQRQGGETCGTLPDWLPKHGWTKITDKSKIKPGAIVAVRYTNHSYIDHVFTVVSYDKKTDLCTKFDTGSNDRINSKQPFENVKLVEWSGRVFVCAWNPPSDMTAIQTISGECDYKKHIFTGVDYSNVYSYNYYKSKYEDLKKSYGDNEELYFKHFCQYGMKEGRIGIKTFDVNKYKDRYEDLRKTYGSNLINYYRHYCLWGKKEGRKGN